MNSYKTKIRLVESFFLLIVLLSSMILQGQNNLVKLSNPNSIDLMNFNFISGCHNYTIGQIQLGNNSYKNFNQTKNLFNSYIYSLNKEGVTKTLSVKKVEGENITDGKNLVLLEEENITIIGENKGIVITKNSGEDCFGFAVMDNNLSIRMEFSFFSGGFRNPLIASNDDLTVILGQNEDSASLVKLVVFDNNTFSVVIQKEISIINQMILDIEITNNGYVLLTNNLYTVETSLFLYDQNFIEIDKITSSKRVYNNDLNYDKITGSLLVQFADELYIYNDIHNSSVSRTINIKDLIGEKVFLELELSSTLTHNGLILLFLKPWKQYPSELSPKIIGISKDNNKILFESNVNADSESLIMVHRIENKIMLITGDEIEIYEF